MAPSLLTFIHTSKSPVTEALQTMCSRLRSEEDPAWQPLLALGPWSEQVYVVASVLCWVEMGELFSRFHVVLTQWPWRLGNLVDDELSDEAKHALAVELASTCDHLDPFTRVCKQHAPTVEQILAKEHIEFLTDLFQNVPVSNIVSETSFAASHIRRSTSHGNHFSLPSLASNHVLAGAKTYLDLFTERQCARQDYGLRLDTTSLIPWRCFLQQRRCSKPMKELAQEWAALSPDEKRAYLPAEQPPQQPRHPPAELRKPWPFCSDEHYPIDAAHLHPVARSVPAMHTAWDARIGHETSVPSAAFEVAGACKGTGVHILNLCFSLPAAMGCAHVTCHRGRCWEGLRGWGSEGPEVHCFPFVCPLRFETCTATHHNLRKG